jgi:hypothetical protein
MTSTLFFNWVLGVVAPMGVWMMGFFATTKSVANIVAWVLRAHPAFALGDGLLSLTNRQAEQYMNGEEQLAGAFDWDVTGADLVYLAGAVVVYTCLTLWLERAFAGTR